MPNDQMKLLIKPFFDWTPEEKKTLPALIETIFNSGVKILVLGHKRCFFCGEELGDLSGETKRVTQNAGPHLIVTNLCDACWQSTR